MIEISVSSSILGIIPVDWDALAAPDFPFCHYHFLRALETTDCLGERTGWLPRYLLAREGTKLLAALILFAKTNSYGEYIFDFAWANAYHQFGLAYYPKLTSAIPFTPATGPKLLFRTDLGAEVRADCAAGLIAASEAVAKELGASSNHALFLPEDQTGAYREQGFFLRDSYQFHWHNEGYAGFEAFMLKLRSKRRREIRRERAQVQAAGVTLERLSGADLNAQHADVFYPFYLSTTDKRGGFDYLTRDFFREVFGTMSSRLLLVLARDKTGEAVAGALNYFGPQTLYGRHWGCRDEYRALHFEVCYYQGLEFAIERGMLKFEAGAQGEHKFQRGFVPTLTRSAHRIGAEPLARAIEDFVGRERLEISRLFEEYKEHDPYSRADTPPLNP